MAALGQTIVVMNKSGKVMKTSKHLVNVFKEAKSAYFEKKAELKATKREDLRKDRSKRRSSRDERVPSSRDSSTSSRDQRRRGSKHHEHPEHLRRRSESERVRRPHADRGYTDSFVANDRSSRTTMRSSPLKYMEEAENEAVGRELVRRHSYGEVHSLSSQRRPSLNRSQTIDMDLAYGELPPPLPPKHLNEEQELKTKMTVLNRILEEANCLQHSATTVIKNLEGNPDAMAAVALTLAEISNIVRKLGPGVLLTMRAAFPTAVALLLSPEFLIAAGVGVGVTVVALGGYKIVKRIKAKKALDKETSDEEAAEDVAEVDRIEHWRQGVVDVETASVGTSVEGELITPGAAKQLAIRDKDQKEQKKVREKERKEDEKRRKREEEAKKKELKEREKKLKTTSSLSTKDIRKDRERRDKAEQKEMAAHREHERLRGASSARTSTSSTDDKQLAYSPA